MPSHPLPPVMSPQPLSYQSPFPSRAVRSRFTEAPYRPRPLKTARRIFSVPISRPVSRCGPARHTLASALLVGGPCGPRKG